MFKSNLYTNYIRSFRTGKVSQFPLIFILTSFLIFNKAMKAMKGSCIGAVQIRASMEGEISGHTVVVHTVYRGPTFTVDIR